MRFRLTDELEAFRREIQEFLRRELPPNWHGLAGAMMAEMDSIKG